MPYLWVFKRIAALDNAQGFVEVPDKLAEQLIREGKASATYDQSLALEPEPVADDHQAQDEAPRKRRK